MGSLKIFGEKDEIGSKGGQVKDNRMVPARLMLPSWCDEEICYGIVARIRIIIIIYTS